MEAFYTYMNQLRIFGEDRIGDNGRPWARELFFEAQKNPDDIQDVLVSANEKYNMFLSEFDDQMARMLVAAVLDSTRDQDPAEIKRLAIAFTESSVV